MNFNRITGSKMCDLEDSNLFKIDLEEGTATPNPRYLTNEVPVYDWDQGQYAWIPRHPMPKWSPDA